MEKKEYLVQVTIIEARHLAGKDDSGLSNPFVKLICSDLQVQSSTLIMQCLTPVWNQSFTFTGLKLDDQEFEKAELSFEMWSKNNFFGNDLIGKYSVGLSTLYRNPNHEYFNVWLTLSTPDDPDESQGFLLADCFIIGVGDRPPVHSINDKTNTDMAEDDEDINVDAMSFEELKAYQEKKQGLQILGKPSVARKSFQLSCYIFKAEGLTEFPGVIGKDKANGFVSVRAVGLIQRTKVVGKNSNPIYNQKLLYPCYYPFLNDKILLRMWHHQKGASDEFIANIPELSVSNDFFNITKLISMKGRMPAKWLNLYGIPPFERNKSGIKKKHPNEGTAYLGRVLLSFTLLPSEKPTFCVTNCNPFYEPDTLAYRLFADIYEVKSLKDYDIMIWCDVTIGIYVAGPNKKKKVNKRERVNWESNDEKNEIALPVVFQHFPKDINCVPDIFINLYTSGVDEDRRIGFIRLRSEDVMKYQPLPRWLHFKSLDANKDSPGSILINIQFVIDNESTKRIFKQKGIMKNYILYSHIVSAFEIDPKVDFENCNSFVKVEIDTVSKETNKQLGRYPFFNELLQMEVELDWKLDFAPDVSVILYKVGVPGLFGKGDNEIIGQFTVPIRTIRKKKYYPHFFNLIKNNEPNGRVCALFYIVAQSKKSNLKKETFAIHEILKKELKANLKIAVLGFRNFDSDIKRENCSFQIKLFQNAEETFVNQSKEDLELRKKINSKEESGNLLNIIQLFEFNNVIIRGDEKFQFFPFVKISLKIENFFSTEEKYLLFNIIEYCSSLTEKEQKVYRKIFEANLTATRIDQEQIIFYELNEKIEEAKEKGIGDEDENEVNEEVLNEEANKEKEKKEVKADDDTENETVLQEKEIVLKIEKYKNMDISDNINLLCLPKDKNKERELKKRIRKRLATELRELRKKDLTLEDDISRLLELSDKIRDLKKPLMNEDIFYGFDDLSDEYDYGREIFREDIYEFHPNMAIQFQKKYLKYIPWGPFEKKYDRIE